MNRIAVVLLSLACVAAFGMAGCVKAADAADEPVMALKGKPAPDFTLKALDGTQLQLSAQKGRVVLVDTWATWCPPCRASLPHIERLATDKSRAEEGLRVWAVNDKENDATVEKFLSDNKYSFTVLLDGSGAMLNAYSIDAIPTTLVVGRDGIVKDVFVGYNGEATAQQIDAAVDKALAEPAPR